MIYGTKGTLRKPKPAEDYRIEDTDLIRYVVVGVLLAIFVSCGILWWYFK
jgi:hypothetical protein